MDFNTPRSNPRNASAFPVASQEARDDSAFSTLAVEMDEAAGLVEAAMRDMNLLTERLFGPGDFSPTLTSRARTPRPHPDFFGGEIGRAMDRAEQLTSQLQDLVRVVDRLKSLA